MRQNFITQILLGMILVLFTLEGFASLPKIGVSQKVSALKSRRAALTSKNVFKKLQRANELSTSENYDKALSILDKLLSQTKERPYEYSQALQSRAFVFASQGKYKKAIADFEEVLKVGALPYGPTVSSMYTLSQLYGQIGNSKKALKILMEWFQSVEEAKPQAYVFYASMLFEQGKKKQALENVDYAISKSSNPKENWLKLSVALNFELNQFKNAERSLRILTQMKPGNKQYWKQLAGTYINLNDFKQALATFELAYKWGHLEDEKDLMNLVSLYIERGIPLKAAQILEKHMKSGQIKKTKKTNKLLSQAYYQAEEIEKSIPPMKLAAEQAKDGQLFFQLGQLYLEKEDFKTAIKYLNNSVAKGGLKKPGYAFLSLGIAQYQTKDINKSLEFLRKARKHEESESAATSWINFISAETGASDSGQMKL